MDQASRINFWTEEGIFTYKDQLLNRGDIVIYKDQLLARGELYILTEGSIPGQQRAIFKQKDHLLAR
jgi:hypothetical protein